MTTLDQYTKICKNIGKGRIPAYGFITPRAIKNTTFLYGDVSASFIPAVTSDSVVFYRYNEPAGNYLQEEQETIKLPNAVKVGAKIVHFDSRVEEKNVFSVSFAVISEEMGKLKVDIVIKEKSFNMLKNILDRTRKITEKDMVYAYELKDEIKSSTSTYHIGQCSCRFGVPYSKNFNIYGGNGTIILYDKEKKTIHRLIMKDGAFKLKTYKFNLVSRSPIFEIVARGLFVVIDDDGVILVDEKITRVNIKKYEIDCSQLFYELIKLKDGENANLLLYSNKTNDALLLITDPTENDFGKAGRFLF